MEVQMTSIAGSTDAREEEDNSGNTRSTTRPSQSETDCFLTVNRPPRDERVGAVAVPGPGTGMIRYRDHPTVSQDAGIEAYVPDVVDALDVALVPERPSSGRFCWICVFSAILLFFMVGFSRTHLDRDAPSTTELASVAPTPQPTIERCFECLRETLYPISGESLTNTSSLPYQALSWMVNDDLLPITVSTSSSALQERYILVLFYLSTNGHTWLNSYSFLSASSVCLWNSGSGVFCDENGNVISVLLRSNNVHGPMPSEFSHLSHLSTLDLSDNQLSGKIDPALGILPDLETVHIQDNVNLHGDLNPTFCNRTDPIPDLRADCHGHGIQCDCCTRCYG